MLLFCTASHVVITLPTIAIAIVVTLLSLIKALAKSNGNHLPLLFANNLRARKSNQEKKQRTDTLNEAKNIKSDNFTRSNRKKVQVCYA